MYEREKLKIGGVILKIKIHDYCVLEKIDESNYKYSYQPAYVNVTKDNDGTWFYTRMNDISRLYKNFNSLQECLDVAYEDMLRSKL